MTMTVDQIAKARRDALLRRWVRDPLQQIAAESPAALGRLAYLDVDAAGTVGGLGRRSETSVVVVTPNGNPDPHAASLWVARGYSGYRAAYAAFLASHYGVANAGPQLAAYDIDHLLNRARSPNTSTFLRIEAIPSHVNQAWGRLFEKTASSPDFWANANRERRTMSWIVAAKLGGQLPPNGPRDETGIRRLAQYFQMIGLDASEAETGLRSMLDFSYGVAR
ncbi:MAG: hypothetical protein VX874_00410 [Pseudomonadota bacterium]|nr:hypothetical protein [Pseudomonadota bacterium]